MLADRKADAERQPWIVRMKERCSERSARLGYVHPRIAGHDAGQVAFRAECLNVLGLPGFGRFAQHLQLAVEGALGYAVVWMEASI